MDRFDAALLVGVVVAVGFSGAMIVRSSLQESACESRHCRKGKPIYVNSNCFCAESPR